MRQVDRTVEVLDRYQRRHAPAGFVYGVVKKFGNDNGGMLAGLMAYYGFLSLFPLLLLLITVVGLATGGDASATHRVEHSALSEFPVIGSQLGGNIHVLHNRAGVGLAIGIVGLIWGSQGVVQSAQFAMAEVWDIPLVDRPGFVPRLLRSLAVIGSVGVFVLASTALAGVLTVGNRGALFVVVGVVVSVLLNFGIFVVAFRLLTPPAVQTRWLLPGAVVGALGWTVLQYVGGALVDHTLRNTSQVYGFFAVVLGLLAWIYLGTQLTVYAAEVNVVRHRRLWPRSLRAPLTAADEEVLRRLVLEQRSRPEQQVQVEFSGEEAAPSPDEEGAAAESHDGRQPEEVGAGRRDVRPRSDGRDR
jgi:YihY family inner membrane protein